MKVAIITSGDPSNTKGIMNYVREKMGRMQKRQDDDFHVDLYMIRLRHSLISYFFLKFFKRAVGLNSWKNNEISFQKGDVTFRNLWIDVGLLNFFLNSRLLHRPMPLLRTRKWCNLLSNYDVLATHKIESHYLGYLISRKYGIPYVATWHGTDIHTAPLLDVHLKAWTKKIIESASMNLFVSKALMNESDLITSNGNKDVIYTGPSASFYRHNEKLRVEMRDKLHVLDRKVISYVGNIVPVKNVMSLPGIFEKVCNNYKGRVKFWIIGNGNQEKELQAALNDRNLDCQFWGKIQPEQMPDYMNCIDVLVFPSIKEGIGLVALEARSCGACVVGSNVGGIPEGIGQDENCFPIDSSFEKNLANRIIEILVNGEKPKPLSSEFSWERAIEKEIGIYRSIQR